MGDYTKWRFANALIDIMLHKPFKKITVKRISATIVKNEGKGSIIISETNMIWLHGFIIRMHLKSLKPIKTNLGMLYWKKFLKIC